MEGWLSIIFNKVSCEKKILQKIFLVAQLVDEVFMYTFGGMDEAIEYVTFYHVGFLT